MIKKIVETNFLWILLLKYLNNFNNLIIINLYTFHVINQKYKSYHYNSKYELTHKSNKKYFYLLNTKL